MRDRKQEQRKSEREREKLEEKNNSLTLDTVFFFFPQPLFPWKPYHRERDGETIDAMERKKKHNRSGLQVMRVHVSSHICGFLLPS